MANVMIGINKALSLAYSEAHMLSYYSNNHSATLVYELFFFLVIEEILELPSKISW
jgi:hypothetical protein